MLKEREKRSAMELAKESKLEEQQEFESAKKKKNSYRKLLDEQIDSNKKMKPVSVMSDIEKTLNKQDLNSYLKNEKKLTALLPGIAKPS